MLASLLHLSWPDCIPHADVGGRTCWLLADRYDSFDDYLEMVIAFGYVTLFASAFPLAAPLTIGCIWVERASDLWAFGHVSSLRFA